LAVTDPTLPPHKGMSGFVVDGDSEGIILGKKEINMGRYGSIQNRRQGRVRDSQNELAFSFSDSENTYKPVGVTSIGAVVRVKLLRRLTS
jgi:hypothetical protein